MWALQIITYTAVERSRAQRSTKVSFGRAIMQVFGLPHLEKDRSPEWGNIEQWRIKPVGLAIIKLCLPEGIVSLSAENFAKWVIFKNFIPTYRFGQWNYSFWQFIGKWIHSVGKWICPVGYWIRCFGIALARSSVTRLAAGVNMKTRCSSCVIILFKYNCCFQKVIILLQQLLLQHSQL